MEHVTGLWSLVSHVTLSLIAPLPPRITSQYPWLQSNYCCLLPLVEKVESQTGAWCQPFLPWDDSIMALVSEPLLIHHSQSPSGIRQSLWEREMPCSTSFLPLEGLGMFIQWLAGGRTQQMMDMHEVVGRPLACHQPTSILIHRVIALLEIK